MTSIPSAYREGYAKAGLHDQAAAGNYVKHTMIGDTALDPIMDELYFTASSRTAQVHWSRYRTAHRDSE